MSTHKINKVVVTKKESHTEEQKCYRKALSKTTSFNKMPCRQLSRMSTSYDLNFSIKSDCSSISFSRDYNEQLSEDYLSEIKVHLDRISIE